MNKPISYLLNKLLIKKGFDYHKLYNDFANEYDYYDRAIQGRLHVSDFSEDKFPDSNKWFPVPYVYQVVMWLYEKHKIWISVDLTENTIEDKTLMFQYIIHDIKTNIKYSIVGVSDLATECYEKAIEYTLTKLI